MKNKKNTHTQDDKIKGVGGGRLKREQYVHFRVSGHPLISMVYSCNHLVVLNQQLILIDWTCACALFVIYYYQMFNITELCLWLLYIQSRGHRRRKTPALHIPLVSWQPNCGRQKIRVHSARIKKVLADRSPKRIESFITYILAPPIYQLHAQKKE